MDLCGEGKQVSIHAAEGGWIVQAIKDCHIDRVVIFNAEEFEALT